ncbi:hypothetical protein [Streptomyces sp. NBC_01465]|uniref:hypothetical protein n=1 Tax=Streptomyces sp. NBC_01465 TaxID=2903878 RepID=UPI002E353D39|nr:hypothetical protein [Streptomyces sp. NBC_01465]
MKRSELIRGELLLEVAGRPGPPPLHWQSAGDGRLLLRQGGRPVLAARVPAGHGDTAIRRHSGFRSPFPPVRAAAMRGGANWLHQYARWLDSSAHGPLHDGRWTLARRSFPPYVWTADLVEEWPTAHFDDADGWNGVLPLRPLPPLDAPRVKAYRKAARDGTLAPVLLWWAEFLDGWLLLDGHDRAAAALAEGAEPPCLVLARATGAARLAADLGAMTAYHEQLTERLAAAGESHQLDAVVRGFGRAAAAMPGDPGPTRTWPLPGGPEAWEALMLECPGE